MNAVAHVKMILRMVDGQCSPERRDALSPGRINERRNRVHVPPGGPVVLSAQRVQHFQHLNIIRYIRHPSAVMGKYKVTLSVNREQCRHPAKFQYFPFLAVEFGEFPLLVGNTDHGKVLFLPILSYSFRCVRRNDNNRCVSRREFLEIPFHPPQMFSCIGSAEPAQEHQQHGPLLPQRRQAYFPAVV